jgi:hypothetical protein
VNDFKKANSLRKEISYRIFRRSTRREQIFLKRAYIDLFKFVPFIVIFMLPGATLFIPIIAYLFPFVLPSKLQPKNYLVNIIDDQLRQRDEERKLLIQLLSKEIKDIKLNEIIQQFETIQKTSEFPIEFMTKIVEFSDYFENNLKLENLSSSLISSIYKFHVFPYFPFLSTKSSKIRKLKHHLNLIQKDDLVKLNLFILLDDFFKWTLFFK